MFARSKSRSAYSLLELVVTISLFGLLSGLSFLVMRNSAKVFASSSGRDRATAQLLKAGQWLRRDLEEARVSPATLTISQVPASLGGGADSEAVNFLSAVDPSNGQLQTQPDGSPFWMRNVLYYGVVPVDYDQAIGQTITGGNVGGYEYNCPAKQLVRVEIDQNSGNDPTNPSTADTLETALSPYLTRPTGAFRSANRKTVASHLLSFRCQQVGPEIRVELLAVSIEDARRAQGFAATIPYNQGKYTLQHSFSVFPKN